jgi:hypothetical protein
VLVEFAGRTCPLTPPENLLRRAVGEAGYAGGHIDHHLWPPLYPAGSTREGQWVSISAQKFPGLSVEDLPVCFQG